MRWKKAAIVGVGLLGGSLGLALRERSLAEKVCGYVRRSAAVEECLRAGAVDEATTDLEQAVGEADLVLLGTPLGQMGRLASRLAGRLDRRALVTDVGSVKSGVMAELEPLFAGVGIEFVGGHPMAGGEQTGVGAARADLFEGAICVITPGARTTPGGLEKVRDLWSSVGGHPVVMDPGVHDEMVARSSHLPHVLAAALVNLVLAEGRPTAQRTLCATGFRDTTRVASGSVEMWRDIVTANRLPLMRALDEYLGDLAGFREALASGNAEGLSEFLERAKASRDRWVGASGRTGDLAE